MARRRSKTRRSWQRKSNNASGFLNDNTAFPDEDDPLWSNRSALRPSNSFIFTKNASSVLSPNSTVNVSQLSDKWFNNLDSSKLTENQHRIEFDEETGSTHADPTTESESEHEHRMKRAKFRLNQTKGNKTDKSNVFLKALEQTTDLYTKNLSNTGIINNSESTNDESKTIKRLRPRIFQTKKHSKSGENNFDDIFHNSVSEKLQINSENSRSLKEKSNSTYVFSLSPEVAKRLKENSKNESNDPSSSKQSTEIINRDKSVSESPSKVLRSRTITDTSSLSNKTSISLLQTKSQKANEQLTTDESLNLSMTETMRKKRRALFSQEQKDKISTSMFDAAFNTDEELNKNTSGKTTRTEAQTNIDSDEVEGGSNVQDNLDDSESSTIPNNLRRTRLHSIFDDRYNAKKTESIENEALQTKSVKHSSQNLLNKSKNISKTLNISMSNKSNNKSSKDTIRKSLIDKSNGKAPNLTSNTEQNQENESLTNLEIVVRSKRVSQVEESSKDENIFKGSHVQKDISKNDERSSDRSLKQKSRISLTQKSNHELSSDRDEELHVNKGNIHETPKSLHRSSLKQIGNISITNSMKNQIVSSINKTAEHDRTENSSNEDQGESSSIPKYIRRTKSRLFQKSQTLNEDNVVTNEIFSVQNSFENISNARDKSTSPRKSPNKTANNSTKSNENLSLLRDYPKRRDISLKNAQVILTRVSHESSNDSLKENRSSIIKPKKSKNMLIADITNESTGKSMELGIKKMNESSRKSHESINNDLARKSRSPSGESLVEFDQASGASGLVKNKSLIKSKKADHSSKDISKILHSTKDDMPEENKESTASSIETSSDGAHDLEVNKTKDKSIPSTITKSANTSKLPNLSFVSDDLLHTPKPAHSTLKLSSKPLTRITQFFKRTSAINESPIPSPVVGPLPLPKSSSLVAPRLIKKTANASRISKSQQSQEDEQNEEVNVTSDHEHLADIPKENADFTSDGELPAFLKAKRRKTINNNMVEDNLSNIDWVVLKKQTDAMKKATEEQMERERKEARDRKRKKAALDAKLHRYKAQLEAHAKKKKKPIDKAYFVNGKLYKQPRLPRPKNWVTDRLYKYLWRCMETKFGPRTRIKSEKFVKFLSDIVTKVERRKKYDNYKSEVDDLLITMAKLNIIETRYDFYRFCSEYLPYSFRIKVVPMMLPGNVRNIPFEPDLVNKPLLNSSEDSESESEEE